MKKLVLCILGFHLFGCSSIEKAIDQSNLNAVAQLHEGATLAEINYQLGKPDGVAVSPTSDEVWLYKKFFVVVRDNKFSHYFAANSPLLNMQVDAVGEAPKDGSIWIDSGAKDKNANDLYLAHFRKTLENVLLDRGYKIAQSKIDSKYVVLVDYNMIKSKESNTFSTPEYYKTFSVGHFSGPGGNISGYTTSASTQVSQRIQTEHRIVYERNLNLTLVGAAEANKENKKIFWNLKSSSEGSNSDMRLTFSWITAGIYNFLGADSSGEKKFDVAESDPRLEKYSNGIYKNVAKAVPSEFFNPENVNRSGRRGMSPLIAAIDIRDNDSLERLLKMKADANKEDMNACRPVHAAINTENEKALRLLLKFNADIPNEVANYVGSSSMCLKKRPNETLSQLIRDESERRRKTTRVPAQKTSQR